MNDLFSMDKNKCVMCPKNSSIGLGDVGGGSKLTAMDIKKLNYAYYCDGTSKVGIILLNNQLTNF